MASKSLATIALLLSLNLLFFSMGLVDLDAAVCLCTVIKADLLAIKLRVPVDLSVLLNTCGKKLPQEFKCA
ncbi:hypothetical protein Tsubulata_043885 [Turnera subulata]|uniref:Hydrophobic seed protein domain-containing protein n=1 Tax=Turnera subulata TaxID=218843 RepID=A0A9Q0F1N7_9ROSI|nr:hypothetical protein Tsubulata_043885 [Turnera subulata]